MRAGVPAPTLALEENPTPRIPPRARAHHATRCPHRPSARPCWELSCTVCAGWDRSAWRRWTEHALGDEWLADASRHYGFRRCLLVTVQGRPGVGLDIFRPALVGPVMRWLRRRMRIERYAGVITANPSTEGALHAHVLVVADGRLRPSDGSRDFVPLEELPESVQDALATKQPVLAQLMRRAGEVEVNDQLRRVASFGDHADALRQVNIDHLSYVAAQAGGSHKWWFASPNFSTEGPYGRFRERWRAGTSTAPPLALLSRDVLDAGPSDRPVPRYDVADRRNFAEAIARAAPTSRPPVARLPKPMTAAELAEAWRREGRLSMSLRCDRCRDDRGPWIWGHDPWSTSALCIDCYADIEGYTVCANGHDISAALDYGCRGLTPGYRLCWPCRLRTGAFPCKHNDCPNRTDARGARCLECERELHKPARRLSLGQEQARDEWLRGVVARASSRAELLRDYALELPVAPAPQPESRPDLDELMA